MRAPIAVAVPWIVVVLLAFFALFAPAPAHGAIDDGPGGPILVIKGDAPGWAGYYAEILRNEGLNEFDTTSLAAVTPGVLAAHDVAILGLADLAPAQATMLGDWVAAGGNLIAMLPDTDLNGLLGITSSTGTLSDAYLKVDTSAAPGAGIVGDTMQFHGAAERYGLDTATAVATLYADATSATANPAVTLRSVGPNGGQAAAFAYELSKSVVYTRQGNPAWINQNRDGEAGPNRSDDLFYGNASFDPQPDWIDMGKVAIPQADEQQRLLANLIEHMNADRTPLPRFWYLPHGEKAAVVMTGDDHGSGGTVGRFNQQDGLSAPGCSVADWECVRSTSYVYPGVPITDAQAAAFEALGFEIALHPETGCANSTPAALDAILTSQLASLAAQLPSLAAPVTSRTHCIAWDDWVDTPLAGLAHGVRLDTNYYYWPASLVQDRPGMFTGSGLPMRFAGLSGSMLDVYQAATQLTDESGQSIPAHISALLGRALGAEGYYGVFTANMHTDSASSPGANAIISAAQGLGVPVVSAKQMLTWIDGRNASSFGAIGFAGDTLSFTVAPGAGATGLQAMVPTSSSAGDLDGITRNGSPVTYTTQTIKGIEYAFVAGTAGSYEATYAPAPPAPSILVDTTTTDFNLGSGDGNTSVTDRAGGELSLLPATAEEFIGPGLPAGWSSSTWEAFGGGAGGSATVSGGQLAVDGAYAGPAAAAGPSRSVEFVATFGSSPFQHVGFSDDFNSAWAIFSTNNVTGQLFARTNAGGQINTPLSGTLIGLPHRYRIVWNPSSVEFYVDGALVATHTIAIGTAMRALASDFNAGGPVLSVDWLRMSPYAPAGTFTSRVLDAGTAVDWEAVAWTADTPAGTGVAISVRTGDTPAPDATWSAFAPIAASGDPVTGHTRYVQYRTELTTSDPLATPVLSDVTFTYGDHTAPVVQIDSGPPSPTSDATPTFEFSSEPGVTFACRIDSGAYTACGSPFTAAPLADGPHTFEVRATDAAGNVGSDTYGFTVATDTSAPDTTIDSGPAGPTNDATPQFTFSSEPGATFTCRLDSSAPGDWQPCSSPVDFTLGDGPHAFEVRATDGSGNTDPTPASRTFTIDTVAPVITIDHASKPSNPTTSTSAAFTFTRDDPGASASGLQATVCRLDGNVVPCTTNTSKALSGLAVGSHTFRVDVTDIAGNAAAGDAHTWQVNSPPSGGGPTLTIAWPQEGGRYSVYKPVRADFTCTSPNGIADQGGTVDDGEPLPWAAPPSWDQTFTAFCEDSLGNRTEQSVHYAMLTFEQIVNDGDPIAYYRLGEEAGNDQVKDSSGNGYDGEAKNATAFEQYGVAGDGDGARRFLGDGGYVYVNDIHAPSHALTLGGWIWFDDHTDASLIDHGYDAGIYLRDGRLHFRMLGTTISDSEQIQPGRWYFVAGTWDGGRMKLYKTTGDPDASNLPAEVATARQSKRPSGISTFYIGYGQDAPWLLGVMDEVFYYREALSTQHLDELWLADPPAQKKGAQPAAEPQAVTVQSRAPDAAAASAQARAKARAKAKARARAKAKARVKARARARCRPGVPRRGRCADSGAQSAPQSDQLQGRRRPPREAVVRGSRQRPAGGQ